MNDEEWETWLAAELMPREPMRTFAPGCLVIIAVCALIWLAAILGVVQLYTRTPTRVDLQLPPPPTTGAPYPQATRTIDGTPTVVMPEDLDRVTQ